MAEEAAWERRIACQFCDAEGWLDEDGQYQDGWGDIETVGRPKTACPKCLAIVIAYEEK